MRQRNVLSSCLVAAVASVTTVALAQDSNGKLQIGLGADVFAHSSTDLDIEVGPVDDDVEDTATTWGFTERSAVSFEMGYGLTDGLILGGVARIGGYDYDRAADTFGDDELKTFELGLFPKIEYMFGAGASVRPFVGGGLGVLVFDYEETNLDISSTSFGIWARGGLRYFAAPEVSLDPTLTLSWLKGSGDLDVGGTDGDVSATRLGIAIGFGLSLWI